MADALEVSERLAFHLRDAAKASGRSLGYLEKAYRRGELRCVRVPGRRGLYVLPEDLERFLEPRPADPGEKSDA